MQTLLTFKTSPLELLSDLFPVEAGLKSVRTSPQSLSSEVLAWVMCTGKAAPGNLPAQDLWGIGCKLAELLAPLR